MSNFVVTDRIEVELAAIVKALAVDRVFVLVDENTAECCLSRVDLSGFDPFVVKIKAGDENKTIDAAVGIWNELVDNGATRSSLLLNVGGGVVTDLGGFVAATFKRGMKFVNVPTTLLGAVDAATGGKTGVNFRGLKNEIGAFAEAERVLAEAKAEAEKILSNAQAQADAIIEAAKKNAAEVSDNTTKELKLYASQALNALKSEVASVITDTIVKNEVSGFTGDKEYLNQFILQLAAKWAENEEIVISVADADSLKGYFMAKAKDMLDKGVKINQVNGLDTLFTISPADGSYKMNFGQEEFENYFKAFLRPQIVETLF